MRAYQWEEVMAYEAEEAKRLVIEAGHRLTKAGLVARTWGNISARISDTQFVITPSGMAYDRITPDDIVTVNIADCSYEGNIKPSSEKGIHAETYALRSDVNFIIHTHQLYATAYGVTGYPLRLRDKVLGEIVPNATYAISATKKLKENVIASLTDNPKASAVFMRGHGALFLGADCESCFAASERLEDLCRAKVKDTLHLDGAEDAPLTIPDVLRKRMGSAALLFTDSPAVYEASKSGRTKFPVIDDMAQIGGTDFVCLNIRSGWEKAAAISLAERNVVFIRGRGAVCSGASPDEAEAVAVVLEKNCLSALYAQAMNVDFRIRFPDALLQRGIYRLKYSKLK